MKEKAALVVINFYDMSRELYSGLAMGTIDFGGQVLWTVQATIFL